MQWCNRNETDEPDAAKLWITYDYIFEANASISKRRILTFWTFEKKIYVPGGLHLPCSLWILKHFHDGFRLWL